MRSYRPYRGPRRCLAEVRTVKNGSDSHHHRQHPDRVSHVGLPKIELSWDDETIERLGRAAIASQNEYPMLAPLARIASRVVGSPFAAITLIDQTTVRLLACHGFELASVPRPISFCATCVSIASPLIVPDASLDERFRSIPLVRDSGVGHYAGIPLISSTGEAIGTICVLGPGPRDFSPADLENLTELAVTTMELLHTKRLVDEYDAQRDQCIGVLEAFMDGVFTLRSIRDETGTIIDFVFTMLNARAEELLHAGSSLLGARLNEAFPAALASGFMNRYVQVAETGQPFCDDIHYDGDSLNGWFEVSAVRIEDGVAVTFRNIDERRRNQAQLTLDNDRFTLLSAATEDIVWDFDIEADHIWWSDNLNTCLGYDPSHIEKTLDWWTTLIHPQDRSTVTETLDQAIRGDENTWSAEYRIRDARGNYLTVLDRAFIIRDDSGRAVRAVGAIIDLSARLQARQEILFRQSLFEAQAEASQDAIMVTDAGHHCVQSNHRFRELVGHHLADEAPHAAIRAIYEHSNNPDHAERCVRAAMDDPWLTIREEIEFRDGRAIELHSEPLRREEGDFLGRVWFVRDLTRSRQTNQLLRAHNLVLEASGIVLFRWRPEPGWPVALVSKNVEQFGYTAQELLGRKFVFADIVHPDDHERVTAEVAGHIESGCESFEQEYRIVCRDGSIRWIYDQSVIDRDENGNLESLQGVVLDITDRRQVEQDLAASEAMLRDLTSQIPGAVYQFRLRRDGTSEIPYISEGIRGVCGISPDHVYRNSNIIRSMILPEDLEHFERSIAHSAKTMQPWNCEFRLRTHTGEARWMSGNSMPRKEADGSIIWHGLMADATTRKNAEEKLRRTSVLLERTNALARVGGWEYDTQTETLYISNEVKRILKIDTATTITLAAGISCFTPESRARLEPAMQRAIEHGESYDLELQIITSTGETRWVRTQGEAIRDNAKTVKLRGALHDINDQCLVRQEIAARAAELEVLRDAAEAASRTKSEFIANMSHEIRTPLTAILGFADLLREENPASEKEAERNSAVDTIAAAGQHLLTVINDILDISKIEAGRMQIDPVEIDLPDLIRDTVRIISVRADAKGIALNARAGSLIPQRVITDPTRLRQMILNILGNAVKFTDSGSVSVLVDYAEQRDQPLLIVDIQDTGPGITKADSARLFAPFSQADSSLQRRHGGTGLGLVISRRCAELLGGTVELLHSEPDVGSCFRITLPIEEAAGTLYTDSLQTGTVQPAQQTTHEPLELRARILFAEDGPDNQRLIAFHLNRAGAQVDIAPNGRIALEMFNASKAAPEPYDLLLTDIQMPEMDGIELTTHLRAAGETIPIIAVTAHAMSEDRDRCLSAGCDDYATKPIDPAKLIATCHAWLGKSSPTPNKRTNRPNKAA